MNLILDGPPGDLAIGVRWAILALVFVGVLAASVALALTIRGRSIGSRWPATWHTAFTIALGFQLSAQVLSVLLLAAMFLLVGAVDAWSEGRWLLGLLLLNMAWTSTGVVLWRRLRAAAAPAQ